MIFTYWNNKNKYHENIIAEILANDILEADKILLEKYHINAAKTMWVSCQIFKSEQSKND